MYTVCFYCYSDMLMVSNHVAKVSGHELSTVGMYFPLLPCHFPVSLMACSLWLVKWSLFCHMRGQRETSGKLISKSMGSWSPALITYRSAYQAPVLPYHTTQDVRLMPLKGMVNSHFFVILFWHVLKCKSWLWMLCAREFRRILYGTTPHITLFPCQSHDVTFIRQVSAVQESDRSLSCEINMLESVDFL